MKKNIFIMILTAVLVLHSFVSLHISADASYTVARSGTCGTCEWTLDEDGTLTIGPGVLDSWTDWDEAPWHSCRSSIVTIVVEEGTVAQTMDYIFSSMAYLESADVGNLDVSNVTSFDNAFSYCYALESLDLSNWDTSSAESLDSTFGGCHALSSLDVSGWDTSNVTSMERTFYACQSLRSLDLTSWDTGMVENLEGTFDDCESLTSLDLSTWDVSNVTTIQAMFYSCYELSDLDVAAWDTQNLTDMTSTFSLCKSLVTLDLLGWDTENVTSMSQTFFNCVSLKTVYVGEKWSIDNVSDFSLCFGYCESIVGGAGTTYDAHYSSAEYAVIDGVDGPGYLSSKENTFVPASIRITASVTPSFIDDATTYSLVDENGDVLATGEVDNSGQIAFPVISIKTSGTLIIVDEDEEEVFTFIITVEVEDYQAIITEIA